MPIHTYLLSRIIINFRFVETVNYQLNKIVTYKIIEVFKKSLL